MTQIQGPYTAKGADINHASAIAKVQGVDTAQGANINHVEAFTQAQGVDAVQGADISKKRRHRSLKLFEFGGIQCVTFDDLIS